jgi:hypothetical protein
MAYTLAQAARETGLNQTAILRSIKSGKISGTRNAHGYLEIEPVELHRIFPASAFGQIGPKALYHDAQPFAQVSIEAQIDLKQLADLLRSQLDDMRQDRDYWRVQAQASQNLIAAIWRDFAGDSPDEVG